jgi:hypothetical protein
MTWPAVPGNDMPDAEGPVSLSCAEILTPGDWTELDLDPSTRRRTIRRAVRRTIQCQPALAANAVRLVAMLEAITQRAHDSGGFYCATLVLGDGPAGVLVASVLMQLVPGPTPPGSIAMNPPELCSALANEMRRDSDRVGAEVSVVELPFVGAAVRSRLAATGLYVQYVVPLPAASSYLVVTFICPCPPYVEPMTKLFDAMASSIRLQYKAAGRAGAV